MSRLDRAIAIALGIVLGLTIVILFVFLGSNSTIDAPSINHGTTQLHPTTTRPAAQERP